MAIAGQTNTVLTFLSKLSSWLLRSHRLEEAQVNPLFIPAELRHLLREIHDRRCGGFKWSSEEVEHFLAVLYRAEDWSLIKARAEVSFELYSIELTNKGRSALGLPAIRRSWVARFIDSLYFERNLFEGY